MKRWNQIFRGLANVNRLKIIALLADGQRRHVSAITRELHISFTATSRHLVLLDNLGILESEGREGHVFYSLNPRLSDDARKVIQLFTRV